jgi:hypothetical protein
MHSVDKFLFNHPDKLKLDPATRASDMRELVLREFERLNGLLEEIENHPHCDPITEEEKEEHDTSWSIGYLKGIIDGHRCAAVIAKRRYTNAVNHSNQTGGSPDTPRDQVQVKKDAR